MHKEFIYKSRNEEKVHSWASLAPLFLWIGCFVYVAPTSMIYYPLIEGNFHMLVPCLCTICNVFFICGVLACPWWRSSVLWKLIRTLVHSTFVLVTLYYVVDWVLSTGWLKTLINMNLHNLLSMNVVCLLLQLFLGILILPRPRVAALLFQPLIPKLFWLLEKIFVCGFIHRKIVKLRDEGEEAGERNVDAVVADSLERYTDT